MKSNFFNPSTLVALLAFLSIQVSSSPVEARGSFAHQDKNYMIKRHLSSSSSSSFTLSSEEATDPLSATTVALIPTLTGSASSASTGPHGYGYGINSNSGTGKSEANGIGFEICLLKEGICFGDAAALAIGVGGGKGDGYSGGLTGVGTVGSVAQAGVEGPGGIAVADAANLCIEDACYGIAGVLAFGSASASAQGGDLTTKTTLLIGTPTSLPPNQSQQPTQTFSTITVVSEIPSGILKEVLDGVAQLVNVKVIAPKQTPVV